MVVFEQVCMVELIISLKLKGFWLSVRKFEALKGLRNSMGTAMSKNKTQGLERAY